MVRTISCLWQDDILAALGQQAQDIVRAKPDIVSNKAGLSLFPMIGKRMGSAIQENEIPGWRPGRYPHLWCGRYLACGKTISSLRSDSRLRISSRSDIVRAKPGFRPAKPDIVSNKARLYLFPMIGKRMGSAMQENEIPGWSPGRYPHLWCGRYLACGKTISAARTVRKAYLLYMGREAVYARRVQVYLYRIITSL